MTLALIAYDCQRPAERKKKKLEGKKKIKLKIYSKVVRDMGCSFKIVTLVPEALL